MKTIKKQPLWLRILIWPFKTILNYIVRLIFALFIALPFIGAVLYRYHMINMIIVKQMPLKQQQERRLKAIKDIASGRAWLK
jgi:hypothetical protein